MGREDGGRIFAELLGNAIAMALDFGRGGGDGLVEPLELIFHGIARQEPPRDTESLVVHDKHFADRHAGRYGNTLETFHVAPQTGMTCNVTTRYGACSTAPALPS